MFGGDDDEEDDSGVSATRYPCMPSLVTLQQMRNRLQLAYTGKKLMNWTALASGRELMKQAKEIYESYKTFREEMRQGYILLARARYSNTYFNGMVLENVGHDANITVDVTTTSVAGVKTLQMNIEDTDCDNYIHLGIGRGGETVAEAKKHWRNLLKKVILMCQQRITYITLETTHRNATKKKQLISKVVIPKLKATVAYILSELEEKEREDTFRLKRFKQLKTKKSEKNKHVIGICEECLSKCESKDKKHDCPVCNHFAPKLSKDHVKDTDRIKDHIGNNIEIKNMKKQPIKEEFKKTSSNEVAICKCPSVEPAPCRCKETPPRQPYKAESASPSRTTSKTSSKSEYKSFGQQPSSKSIPVEELGTFENKFKETIKVTRLQNYDGTISEEKQVITIRTEKRTPRKPSFDKQKSERSFRIESHGNNCHNIGARVSKSEENRCCSHTGEPTVRTGSLFNRTTVNRHRIPCSGSYNDFSIKSTPSCNSCYEDTKNSSTMTGIFTDRNRMPGSSGSSLSNRVGRNVTRSKSSCCGTSTCPGNLSKQKDKFKTVSTNAATRDASTSTTNIKNKSSNQRKTTFLIGACTSCPSFSMQPRLEKFPPSSKSCSNDVMNNVAQEKLELNPKLIKNLKNIFRTPPSAKKPQKVPAESIQSEERSTQSNECQVGAESDEEIEITQCHSCGSITIRTCKSTGIDTKSKNKAKERNINEILDCKSKSNKSMKSDDDDEDIRRGMAQTAKSFNSVCRSKPKLSSSCPACPRDSCASCGSQNARYKDASTNTRRSARYDVRGVASTPIRLQARKKSTTKLNSCSCTSDITMMKDKQKVRPIRPPSFLPA